MAYESLMEEVEQCSEDEILEINERTDAAIREIVSDCEEKIRVLEERYREDAVKRVEDEKSVLLSKIKAENQKKTIREKNEVYSQTFSTAAKSLENIRGRDDYVHIFRKLADEVLQAIQEDQLRVHVDPRDEAICREVFSERSLQCEIITDLVSLGGLNISTPGETVTVYNTLESRLNIAEDVLKLEIFSLLYGDPSCT